MLPQSLGKSHLKIIKSFDRTLLTQVSTHDKFDYVLKGVSNESCVAFYFIRNFCDFSKNVAVILRL